MTLAMLPVALMLVTGCGPNAEESSAEDSEAKLARARADYEAEPGSAAAIYGIGNWNLYEGRHEKAREIFLDLLATDQWAAFGYIAAEAEIARSGDQRF